MRFLRRSPLLITLLCVLLIAVRISGAHWHLCLDGSEPPQAMQIGEADLHPEGEGHQDVDLKLIGDALAKNLTNGLDAPLLAAFVLLWLFQFPPRTFLFTPYRETLFFSHVLPSHAPPRAPPR